MQTDFPKSLHITFELPACYQLIVAVDGYREAIMFMNVVQDREEDDEQFLVEVYLSFLVDRIHIYGAIVLHNGWCSSYRARPIYLVEASMHVLDDEHEELLVVLAELYHRQQDVEECVVSLLAPFVHLSHLLVIDYRGVVALVVVEHDYGSINPYREVIDKALLLVRQRRLIVNADDILRPIFPEHQFLSVLYLQQHLRKNKDTVVNVRMVIEIITNIIDAYFALDVLQCIYAVNSIFNILGLISVFFY